MQRMNLTSFKVLTRFEQTLFALPLILGGVFLALPHATSFLCLLWIVPAFLSARISGMAFNQLIDRHIDACNPRTENRMIPSGRVSVKEAHLLAWGSLAVFLFLCLQINHLTTLLGPIAAFLIYVYSYTKRFHWGCHFVLGSIHFFGPVMAFAAATDTLSLPILFLGGAACFSIVGNDIVYGMQDFDFDRRHKLFSIPARFGVQKSLLIAAGSHCICLFMLLGLGLSAHFPIVYYLLIPTAGVVFFLFHYRLHGYDMAQVRLEPLFFFCGASFSFLVLFFIAGCSLWPVIL